MNEYQRIQEMNKNESHRGSEATMFFSFVEADEARTMKTQNEPQSAVESSQLNLLITESSADEQLDTRKVSRRSTEHAGKLTGDSDEMKD